MTKALEGKVALVTGGSRGIGAATARRLAEEGADVAFTFHQNQRRADEVADRVRAVGRRAVALRVDSADPDAVTEAVDRVAAELGRLDILVNNAGAGVLGPIQELTRARFDHTIAVNVRAPFVAAQAALRHMTAGGRIINIGGNVAERVVFPGFSAYATSKAAMTGLTKALGRELGPRAITVNLVHPGATDTDMNPAGGPAAEAQAAHTALGHYATPADIAAAVAFLAGPDARYITGTSITVDGGFNS
jgi:3-oxoacyl-[acyl-carrier protein] reductase